MLIADGSVVTFDYVLKNGVGEILDSSEDGPMTYLHGHGNIVPGLERALKGKSKGDALEVVVPPSEGYGERSGEKPFKVPLDDVPPGVELEEGMGLSAEAPNGQEVTLWVVSVKRDHVMVSLDHPLAGEPLHFAVTVREVRAASAEELAHGHVHGPDGHDHGHGHDHGPGGHHHH